ncbi:MAG: hypothetical protein HYW79_03870 [Parcubacteria group bacterium]|nr:hypothetical protein [Parcubacteria group bacterium]
MPLTTKHQVLAWDLVEGLDDEKHKGVYFRLAKTYDESFLRRILSLVKDVWRQGKIKSEDRGKYFMGILKKELSSFAPAYAKASAGKKATEGKQIYGKSVKNNSRGRSGSKKKIGNRKRPKKSGNPEIN